ncbi:MAG: cation transporter, partial [Nocardioides sp.]
MSAAVNTSPSAVPEGGLAEIDLDLEGMTCASCAHRIERKLNKLPGVQASVNYATERAHVVLPAGLGSAAAIQAVEQAGYRASVVPETPTGPARTEPEQLPVRTLFALVVSVPVIALAMVPVWQFDGWQWVSLALATPVVWWAGWPFHRAALVNARHGASTMDTLVSIGVTAAYLWSVVALIWGDAGAIGYRHTFDLGFDLWRGDSMDMAPSHGHGLADLYLETAAGVTAFLLLGRALEARAKRRSGAALTALLDLGAREVHLLEESGHERSVPIAELAVGGRFVVRPGERVAADGIVESGVSALDNSSLTGESMPVDVGAGDPVAGGAVNAQGRLVVRATRVGADTHLACLT